MPTTAALMPAIARRIDANARNSPHRGNAAVVGILLAALYDPVWTSAVHSGRDFALVVVALAMLGWWRVPSWAVVLLTALLAWWVV
jgi:chromate transporter